MVNPDSAAGPRIWPVALPLALAGLLAYANTFSAPFVFDDIPALARHEEVLIAGWRGSGAAGRPVVQLSLALNRLISGDDTWSYHAFNLLVHVGAGLALFGVVRRTLLLAAGFRSPPRERREELGNASALVPALTRRATEIAAAVALLWLVHPLQTESVTCVIQRTESLAGLFYLLLFLGFARAIDDPADALGPTLMIGASVLGAATKELMATAPVLLLLYDRTFVAGTFRGAWRARGLWHAGQAMVTWGIVGALIWKSDVRGGTVGFGHGVAWWEYALTQCRAVAMYFKLAVWPYPLVLDYGTDVERSFAAVWPQALLLVGLVGATVWALVRKPVLGFLGAWCFVILAPSSSVVPLITQTMAEHRMYLPLAGLVVLGVLAACRVAGRGFGVVVGAAAVALLAITVARNQQYRSVEGIWRDNLAKRPGNARAYFSLGQMADGAGQHEQAVAYAEAALRLVPDDPTAHFNLAYALMRTPRREEAVQHFREAARLRPNDLQAQIHLGAALVQLGRFDEAIAVYEIVVRLDPRSAKDQFNLAQVYAAAGQPAAAVPYYASAAKLDPQLAGVQYPLGLALLKLQRMEDAAQAFRAAVEENPRSFEAHVNLGGCLLVLGRPAEAVPVYEAALRLRPGDAMVTANLARAKAAAAQ